MLRYCFSNDNVVFGGIDGEEMVARASADRLSLRRRAITAWRRGAKCRDVYTALDPPPSNRPHSRVRSPAQTLLDNRCWWGADSSGNRNRIATLRKQGLLDPPPVGSCEQSPALRGAPAEHGLGRAWGGQGRNFLFVTTDSRFSKRPGLLGGDWDLLARGDWTAYFRDWRW